ncbi:CLUMA_CG006408, isoform A [Clunio marinus]|uniref:CLUMA_CG006408, isoform A n=1 Tax=Clunio marinus TaxID=568069 RepID=A0A1J1HX63_9DIPT|nr:CLUMA_CG006408, isoform A [Clunio marinus]
MKTVSIDEYYKHYSIELTLSKWRNQEKSSSVCSRYAHRGSVCKEAEECCPKCSKPHSLKKHDDKIHGKESKDANEKLKLNFNVNHAVWDEDCEVYKMKLKKYIIKK